VIENATISGSSTFEGSTTVDDGTGSLQMFTRSAASFASQSIPQGVVRLTCVVSEFNDRQVFIRNLGDIE
jgi:autotransporter-associated beta strand protein